jgi:hypothetical protein
MVFKSVIVLCLLAAAAVIVAAEKKPDPAFPDSSPKPKVLGALKFESEVIGLSKGYKLLYEQRFDKPNAIQDFVMTDPKAWKLCATNDLIALELIKQSEYKPLVRSPVNIALIADRMFGDFILEADFIQTGREYGHRDMCVFYGFQSPTNFYYAHIATAADKNAHNIFIVNNAPRTNIAKETTKGVNWGLGIWHRVRLERRISDGSIKVYFDDMEKPIMTADDKTFPSGYIGFGSFDDTGMVDNIRVWGPSMETRKTGFFVKPQ